MQDVIEKFVRTFTGGGLPDEAGSMGWMASVMHNAFVSRLRRGVVQEKANEDPTYGLIGGPVEDEELPRSRTVSDEDLRSAVEALSPKLRAAFELNARGRSYQQIARELQITEGAVAKRLHDARKRLTRLLGPGDAEEAVP